MSMRSEVLKDSSILTVLSFFSKGLSFIASILVARMLLPDQLGLLDLAVTFVISIFSIFSLNIHFGLSRIIPSSKDKGRVISAGLSAIFILSIIGLIIFFIIQPIIVSNFNINLAKLYILVLFSGFCFVFFIAFQYVAQGMEDFFYYNLSVILQSSIFFLLILLDFFFILPFGVRNNLVSGAILFYLVSYFVPIFYGFFRFKHLFVFSTFKDIINILKQCIAEFSAPLLLSAFIILLQKFIFFGVFPAELGQSRVIDVTLMLITIPMLSLGTVLFPKLTKINIIKIDSNMYNILFARLLIFSSFYIFLINSVAYYFIIIFFSSKYILAAQLFSFGALSSLFGTIFGLSNIVMFSMNQFKQRWLFLSILMNIITFILTFWLIPIYGLFGLLLLTSIIQLIGIIFVFDALKKVIIFSKAKEMFFYSLLVTVFILLNGVVVQLNPLIWFVYTCFSGLVLCFFAVNFHLLTKEDFELILNGINYVKNKIESSISIFSKV